MFSSSVKEVFRKAYDAVIIHFQSSDLRSVSKKVHWESLELIIVDEPVRKACALLQLHCFTTVLVLQSFEVIESHKHLLSNTGQRIATNFAARSKCWMLELQIMCAF